MINFIQILILGFVQGVTELLPVSGSAHQRLLEVFFGISDTGLANQLLRPMIHLGVLLTVVVCLRYHFKRMLHEIPRMLGGGNDRKRRHSHVAARSRKMMGMTLIASLPLFVLPFFRSTFVELNQNLFFVGGMLILTGFVLYGTRRISFGDKRIEDMSVADSVVVGLSQLPSVLTGISRSGVTMSIGLWRGLDPMAAIDFSYLISAPALLGTVILELVDSFGVGVTWGMVPEALAALAAAAFGSYLALRIVRFVFRRNSFAGFAYYCLGGGMIVLLLALIYI